jgi:diaminohydroxyphosphoribosylaminopyrimidine deaminase / 5-amino-6-(5-phosphoribosylamino)uracil reductase
MTDDVAWMRRAIELSKLCPPSAGAFSVGAVVVAADGTELSTGYSRETDLAVHAEEAALAKVDPEDPRLPGATVYSTLEPCSTRKSRPVSCAEHILGAGIRRVVIAWREPSLFVEGEGVEVLTAAGASVVELTDLAAEARAVNRHLDLDVG